MVRSINICGGCDGKTCAMTYFLYVYVGWPQWTIAISGSAVRDNTQTADTAECTSRMQDLQMAKPPGDNDLLSAVVYLTIPRGTRRNI